jgi:hypothetical protein
MVPLDSNPQAFNELKARVLNFRDIPTGETSYQGARELVMSVVYTMRFNLVTPYACTPFMDNSLSLYTVGIVDQDAIPS